MRISRNVGLPLSALLFAAALIPSNGWASTSKNCPPEPATQVPIISGETYYGTNCVISKTGDVDSFQFNASAGSTWSIVAGLGPPPEGANVCLALYAPGTPQNRVFFGCSNGFSVSATLKLAIAGLYTIDITESTDAVISYGLSLERLNPQPSDAVPLVLGQNYAGEVTPPTAQDAFTFCGSTAGTYQIAASIVPGSSSNVCFAVYENGTSAVSGMCSNGGSVLANLTPTQDGTFVVVVYAAVDYSTVNYNLEVSCLVGNCVCKTTKCLLEDALTYDAPSSTLTMNFSVGTPYPATWNSWLVSGNAMELLWSQPQPVTEPPATVTKTQAVVPSGEIGILSTLTTPTKGIAFSSWKEVSTGKP